MAHQHNAVQCHSCWMFCEIEDSRQIKIQTIQKLKTTQKKTYNTKYSKTRLP